MPKSSREEFIRAAQTNNILALNVAVCDLPQTNRDTLSYLMLHLQKVCWKMKILDSLRVSTMLQVEALKDVNKMTAENIARCLAIPIMGQSSYPRGDIHVASNDAREKERSVLQMLRMSSVCLAFICLGFLSHESTVRMFGLRIYILSGKLNQFYQV